MSKSSWDSTVICMFSDLQLWDNHSQVSHEPVTQKTLVVWSSVVSLWKAATGVGVPLRLGHRHRLLVLRPIPRITSVHQGPSSRVEMKESSIIRSRWFVQFSLDCHFLVTFLSWYPEDHQHPKQTLSSFPGLDIRNVFQDTRACFWLWKEHGFLSFPPPSQYPSAIKHGNGFSMKKPSMEDFPVVGHQLSLGILTVGNHPQRTS